MRASPRASIVINNYNYGRFLTDAIESALNQTCEDVEVVVVDDGSTDRSPDIIAGYANRIVPVVKRNEGQASAFNAGFAASRGHVIVFLDSDDTLLPTAVESALPFFRDTTVAKVHWPLWEIDQHGRKTGKIVPEAALAEGDLRDAVARDGPASHVNPPTSGNAWARTLLERILPVPAAEYRIWADVYLLELAPLFGRLGRLAEPHGCYRVHGANHYASRAFDERLRRGVEVYGHVCAALSKHGRDLGMALDAEVCRRKSWFHRVQRATAEIAALVPPGQSLIFVDQDEWGTDDMLAGRRRIPFLERRGQYWGAPPDDDTAVREVERMRRSGAAFMVFAWPAFWWLEHYAGMRDWLHAQYRCVRANDLLVAFDLEMRG